jgi:anti-sigma B factor antagonist
MESATIRPVIGGTRQHARQVGFEVSTEPLDGGTAVVSVIGAVDVATAPALRHALLAAAANRLTEVVIDLTDRSFLDSQGLHALLAARSRLEQSGRTLALVISRPGLLKVFRVTGLEETFAIHPSLHAALDRHGGGNHGSISALSLDGDPRRLTTSTESRR